MTSSTERQRLRIGSPVELAALVPHLLGFRPKESVVVVGLHGNRFGLSVRFDLMPEEDAETVCDAVEQAMIRSGATAFFLVVVSDEPGLPPELPWQSLVDSMANLSLPMREAVLSRDDRCWSYTCDVVDCCPVEGRPVDPDSDDVVKVSAAYAAVGQAVLASREELVASILPVSGTAANLQRARIESLALENDGKPVWRHWKSLQPLIASEVARYEDPRSRVDRDVAAVIALATLDITMRDRILRQWARSVNGEFPPEIQSAWRRLFLDLVRTTPAPYDAPLCAMFAMVAYRDGEGVLVQSAAERALATDPTYSLARLVLDLLGTQTHPRDVIGVWAR